MNNNFALYDTIREKVLSYPRGDDEPVIGIDPRYLVLRIVREDKPEVFTISGFSWITMLAPPVVIGSEAAMEVTPMAWRVPCTPVLLASYEMLRKRLK